MKGPIAPSPQSAGYTPSPDDTKNIPTKKKAESSLEKQAQKLLKQAKRSLLIFPGRQLKNALSDDLRARLITTKGKWNSAEIRKEVDRLSPEFIIPILQNAPKNEHKKLIKTAMAREIFKRQVITVDTGEDRARKLLLSHQLKHKADQLEQTGRYTPKERNQEAAKLRREARANYRQAHKVNQTKAKTLDVLGKGSFGKAEAIVPDSAGPLMVKKTSRFKDWHARQEFEAEDRLLQSLDHPNIAKGFLVPDKDTNSNEQTLFMASGGKPLTDLIDKTKTGKGDVVHGIHKLVEIETPAGAEQVAKVGPAKAVIRQIINDIAIAPYLADYNSTLARIQQQLNTAAFSQSDIKFFLSTIGQWLPVARKNPQYAQEREKILYGLKGHLEGLQKPEFKKLTAGGAVPVQDIQKIAAQIADGLVYMNKRGMVHADIKPDNVLIQPDKKVKIIDLGNAATIKDLKKGICSGSPVYMAPEMLNVWCQQPDAPQDLSEKIDVYSLGCLLCQLTTGSFYNDMSKEFEKGGAEELMANAVDDTDKLQRRMWSNIQAKYPNDQKKAQQLFDLLVKMLEPYPKNRISMQQIQQHPFFQS